MVSFSLGLGLTSSNYETMSRTSYCYHRPLFAVPPDILDRGTSTDQTVREGASVSLTCAATGSPQPQITWRREHSKPITVAEGIQGIF